MTDRTVVIGAGPGGYVAAIRAAQLGQDVILVDESGVGGTCLNHGCIPSKALLSATQLVETVTDATEMGIHAEPYVDLAAMMNWKDGVVDRLTGGVASLCQAHGVDLIEARASLVDEDTVAIDAPDGRRELPFDSAVVATGSQPVELDGLAFDGETILSSKEALALEEPPARLVVVGAGYIGMELASVFANLGSDVTILEALEAPLPGFDPALAEPVVSALEEKAVTLRLERRATGWRETASGVEVLVEHADGAAERYGCDRVLVAAGREPVTRGLGLDAAGIETAEGFIETDAEMRTSNDRVFAVGDVAGEPMLAHKASHEGLVAAKALSGDSAGARSRTVPAVVYTHPEIAIAGLGPEAAAEDGYEPAVEEFPFAASGRALTAGHEEGFVRLVADEPSGQLLGGQIVGPEASELIAEIALAIDAEHTVEEIANVIHPHPTLSEAVMEAAADFHGAAIHTPE